MPTYNQIIEHEKVMNDLGLDRDGTPKVNDVKTTFTGELIEIIILNKNGEHITSEEQNTPYTSDSQNIDS